MDIAALKAAVDFRELVGRTHTPSPDGKVHCPYHDDAHPSCQVYPDGFKCFACGAYGDHFDWLERVLELSTKEAMLELSAWSGQAPLRRPRRRRSKVTTFQPLSDTELRGYRRRLGTLRRLPGALEGRGLTLADAHRLGLAPLGEDVLLPIFGPTGEILAVKRRFARSSGPRYAYVTAGHGSPAWCSPGCSPRCSPEGAGAPTLLVAEGELNGMVSYLALESVGAEVAVMAAAGAHAGLHREALTGKRVFIYADADAAGKRALARWSVAARRAGAKEVRCLTPFQNDACALAGRDGRPRLAARLLEAMCDAETTAAGRLAESLALALEPAKGPRWLD